MNAKIFAGCILGLLLAVPQATLGQYGRYRGGVVWGPDGPLYTTTVENLVFRASFFTQPP